MLKLDETTVNCVNNGGKINDILLFFSCCSLSHSSGLRHTSRYTHIGPGATFGGLSGRVRVDSIYVLESPELV